MTRILKSLSQGLTPFVALLLAVTAFRFWLVSAVPLSADEAYHWEWSRHLAFSYYDHPGLTAWVIWVFTRLFGHTLIGVRAGALASTTVVLVVIYILGKDIYKSHGAGFFGFAIAAFTGILSASSLMMTTDPPYAAFWSLSVLFMYYAIFRQRPAYFYPAGVALGFSMLGKFLGLLLVPSILFFFIFSRAHRFWLRRKEPYIACALGFFMLAPVVYWNAGHDWSTLAFNLSIRHKELSPHILYLLEYIAGQSLLVSPLVFFPLLYILWRAWKPRSSNEGSSEFFLFSFTALPIALFGFVSIFERAGAHWPAAAYITGIPLFAGWLLRSGSRPATRYVHVTLILLVVFLSAGHVFLLRPDLIPEFRYKAWPKKINTKYLREYYGWEELGRVLSKRLEEMGLEKTFLVSPYYSLSATISFYTPGQPFCHHMGPESVHGNNYRYWTDWQVLKGRNAIHIGLKELRGKERSRLERAFERIEPLEPLPVFYRGNLVRRFYLTLGYSFKGIPPE
jgi:4-amino-4-deoxy-L-arabinose transferase-like glycosyltransferase